MKLHHLVQEPKIILDQNPVIILLHGYGSNEEDLFSFATEFDDLSYIISVRAPYDLQYKSFAWYAINFDANENKFSDVAQAKSSRDLMAQFIDNVLVDYPIDKNNVTLIGFSQGCILSYAIALSYPEKIQKVVALSGYLNTEICVENYEKNNFSNLAIYASHGIVDQVIPVDWARNAKPVLDSLHIKNTYSEYPIGHGISPQNFQDFKKWLAGN